MISIFDIPHLKEIVAHYLSRRDLAYCARASKEWNAWFTPILWRHPNFKKTTSQQELNFLTRHNNPHVAHVQSFDTFTKELASITPTPSFPNLQRLCYSPTWTASYDESIVLRFIKSVPSLQNLTVTLSLSREGVLSELLDTLKALPQLKKIDLACYQIISAVVIQQIIQTCSQYETLRLSFGGQAPIDHAFKAGEERELCNSAKEALGRMPPMSTQVLSIRLASPIQESAILAPLLERCPVLERLDMDWINNSSTLPMVNSVLGAGKCPRLKFVQLGAVIKYEARDEDIAGLMRVIGCSNVDNDDSDEVNNWGWGMRNSPVTRRGLQTLVLDSALPFEQGCVQALIQYHADTITILDIMGLRQMRIELATSLAAGLPHLQYLTVAVWLKSKDNDAQTDMDTLFKTQWKCLELRRLKLCIQHSDDISTGTAHQSGDGSPGDQYLGYLFSQIGRLTKLEEWSLTSWADLLTIKGGYLSWLPQLKQLKGLNLKRYPNNKMGAEEAEWILEHWPRLVHVTVYAARGSLSDEDEPFFAAKSVLLDRRPWMRIGQ
ncbi:hypothetical protein BGX27_008191 [Mortierella sp. AM989]|nr:hypothetical protein BGX27_008191 [Mortierella sp. AM989]